MLYNVAVVSAIQHESALRVHISSFLDLPPTPIPCLQVIPEYQAEFPGLYGSFPIPIYFTHGSIYISMPLSIYPPSSSPTVSTSMFSMSVSVFLPCKWVHHYLFLSRFYIQWADHFKAILISWLLVMTENLHTKK